jgi:hypothetical protein
MNIKGEMIFMQKKETLREYLARNGFDRGSNTGFTLFVGPFAQTQMDVCRRYLESAPFKYLLDYVVDSTWGSHITNSLCILVVNPRVEAAAEWA